MHAHAHTPAGLVPNAPSYISGRAVASEVVAVALGAHQRAAGCAHVCRRHRARPRLLGHALIGGALGGSGRARAGGAARAPLIPRAH